MMRRKHKRRWSRRPPPFSESQILAWADAFHERTGQWPKKTRGRIAGSLGEKWGSVDRCLREGQRGLPGGSSLPRLLAQKRGVRNIHDLPPLTESQILAWVDAFHKRTGAWPNNKTSGFIAGSPGEKWTNVDQYLRLGLRGFPQGSSLARLLTQKRGVRNVCMLPPLVLKEILAWADAFHKRTGQWPKETSGRIPGSLGETWCAVDTALRDGLRGLAGGSSLPRLLARKRGVRNRGNLTPLTTARILRWADAHQRRTGAWPKHTSGPIAGSLGEKWAKVDNCLRKGLRGLPKGSSLARLLAQKRGVRNRRAPPPLSLKRILIWADAYHKRTGRWPNGKSGPIPEAPGESWASVEHALRRGSRGLRPGGSIYRLLMKQRDCV